MESSVSMKCGLLLLLAVLLYSCENDIKAVKALGEELAHVDRYEDIHITYSDSARLMVDLYAPLMTTHYEKNQPAEDRFDRGVLVIFYNQVGDTASELRARKATRYIAQDLIAIRDSVALVSTDGDTLRTEELFWDSGAGRLYTTGAFRYANPTERIFGYRFNSDDRFETFSYEKMSGHMQVKLPAKSE